MPLAAEQMLSAALPANVFVIPPDAAASQPWHAQLCLQLLVCPSWLHKDMLDVIDTVFS